MKKKLLTLVSLALVLMLALSGCVTKIPGEGEKVPEEINKNSYTYDHVSIALPEGFTAEESGVVVIAVGPDYPDKSDNITFSKGGADKIDNYTKSVLDSTYATILAGFQSSDLFEKTKIGGMDAIKYRCKVSTNDIDMTQTQYFIFGSDYSDVVTFTSATGTYDKAFEDAAASIAIIK